MKYRADRICKENMQFMEKLRIEIIKEYKNDLTSRSCCLIREFSWLYDLCNLVAAIAGKYPGETMINLEDR